MKMTKEKDVLAMRGWKNVCFVKLMAIFVIVALLGGWSAMVKPAEVLADETTASVTIKLDGEVKASFSRAELAAMDQVKSAYSTINTWPTKNWYAAEGVSLQQLLTETTEINLETVDQIKIISVDSYQMTFTRKELLDDQRYYYPGLKANAEYDGSVPGSPDGAVSVETILALQSTAGTTDLGKMVSNTNPLFVIGQRWVTEQTNSAFVKNVAVIELSTTPAGQWGKPTANVPGETVPVEIAPGGTATVPMGTEVTLGSPDENNANVYYTIDGNDPTFESLMFNWKKSRWWGTTQNPNPKIVVNRDMTIKAVAIGFGKRDGDVVAFNFQVEEDPDNPTPVVVVTSPTVATVYAQGERVTISGTAQNLSAVSVNVAAPDGQSVYSNEALAVTDGQFSAAFDLAADAALGNYTVSVGGVGVSAPKVASFQVTEDGNLGGPNDGTKPDHIVLSWTDDPQTSQTVSWRTSETGQNQIQYLPAADFAESESFGRAKTAVATVSSLYTSGEDAVAHFQFEVTLKELTPETGYVYRVGQDGAWNDHYAFTTAGDTTQFSFLYMGDVQEGYGYWGEELKGAALANPDLKFSLLGGDLVDSSDAANWQQFFAASAPVFAGLPLMPAAGNHDGGALFRSTFALPENGPAGYKEQFYSFDYGNSHITVLDSNYMGAQGVADYAKLSAWLREDLTNSTSQWKFVVLHHPLYPARAEEESGLANSLQQYWAPILEEGGVDVVFMGHQHLYMRTKPLKDGEVQSDGITYVMGNSGAKYYPAGPGYDYVAKEVANVSNYQVIKIDGDALTLTSKDPAGSVIDSFTIRKVAYKVEPSEDEAYTISQTDSGLHMLTVKNGITGWKYFRVDVEPVIEHPGEAAVVFVQFRDDAQIGLVVCGADFNVATWAQAGFNVQAGDVIKIAVLDGPLTNDLDDNPIVLE